MTFEQILQERGRVALTNARIDLLYLAHRADRPSGHTGGFAENPPCATCDDLNVKILALLGRQDGG